MIDRLIDLFVCGWLCETQGEDMPVKLSFKDIIFVMEDVDAASPIVHARTSGDSKNTTTKVTMEKSGADGADRGPEKVELTKQVSNSAGTSTAAAGDEPVDLGEGGDAGLVMAMLSSLADSAGGSGDKKGYVCDSTHTP
jgi:hypothetical protein